MTEGEPCAGDLCIRDLSTVHTGQRIEVWGHQVLRYRGPVEECMPRAGVVWLREAGAGERRMISTQGYSLRRC